MPRRLLLALVLFSGTACRATPAPGPVDSTVRMHTRGKGELGVSTDYGVVFLGRGARSGSVEFTVWYDDGPSREEGIIEPVGGGLFMTRAEIVLPIAQLTFVEPEPGSDVIVRGRDRSGPYEIEAEVAHNPRVEGLILRTDEKLDRLGADQTGAGVYVVSEGAMALVGLVSGRLRVATEEGSGEYLTVVGPRDLWRLVTHQRNLKRPQDRAQRGDIR